VKLRWYVSRKAMKSICIIEVYIYNRIEQHLSFPPSFTQSWHRRLDAERTSVLALGRNHTAHLVSSLGASILLEPSDEGGDGEGLGNSAVTGASTGSRSGSSNLGNLGGSGLGGRCTRLGRRRGGDGLSGVVRRGGSGWSRVRSTAHLEIDARLVRLVDRRSIPPPLDNTVAGFSALSADIRHGNVKLGPFGVAGHGLRGQGVLVKADEGLANDRVGADLDDGDVGNTVVGRANFDFHRNLLARSVVENLASVLKGNTLALPDAAVRVGALQVLHRALNVAKLIGRLLVEDLVTASGLEALAGLTRSRRLDEAVGGNRRSKASKGNGGGKRLHLEFVVWFVLGSERCGESAMEV
jgi:hypothetical protein